MTPEHLGEAASFEIAHAEDGNGWTVHGWWKGEDPRRAPGRPAPAPGPTIEQALAAAAADMTEDEPDTNGPTWGIR
jgi:hypothetical protein